VAELRATLAGRERVLADQAREVERLSAQEREAERAAARADELRHKYRELKVRSCGVHTSGRSRRSCWGEARRGKMGKTGHFSLAMSVCMSVDSACFLWS